jgi:hypothetical protein
LLSNGPELALHRHNREFKKNMHKGVSMIKVDFGPISETVYIDIILNKIIER